MKELPGRQGETIFKPGQSGNPGGRPKGNRNKLSEKFLAALCDDFDKHGIAVIEQVRQERPDQYLRTVATIVPKEFHIKDTSLEEMSDDELIDHISAVRAVIVASNRKTVKSRIKPKAANPKAGIQLN